MALIVCDFCQEPIGYCKCKPNIKFSSGDRVELPTVNTRPKMEGVGIELLHKAPKRRLVHRWTCSDFVHHSHRYHWTALWCSQAQRAWAFIRNFMVFLIP